MIKHLLLFVLAGLSLAAPTTDHLVYVGPDVNEMGNAATALYRIRANGTGRQKITDAGRYQRPDISRVGAKLLFTDYPMLHVCDWDGSNRVNIRPVGREHFLPAWSPDGKQVAFASDATNDGEIWLMAADGADARNLTWSATSADLDPAWSPDGRQLAFVSSRGGAYQVYIMDLESQMTRPLAPEVADARYPAWSPDGRSIAVGWQREGDWDIVRIDVVTGAVTPLVESPGWDGQPAWDATGKSLAFVSDRDGSADIWILEVADGELRNITQTDTEDETWPVWVPELTAADPLPITEARLSTLDLPRPRLLFTPAALPSVRERLARPPYLVARDAFLARCDQLMDPASAPAKRLRQSIAEIREKLAWNMAWQNDIMDLAFAYQLTGEKRYGEFAVPLFLEVCESLTANHPQPLLGLWQYRPDNAACTYDWLHDLFSPQQRKAVATLFASSCRAVYARTMTTPLGLGPGWEELGGRSNFAVFMSYAVGTPALALAGDPEYDPNWLAMGIKILELISDRWFDDAGACIESSAYFVWPLEGTMVNLVAMNDLGITDCLQTGRIANWPNWYAISSGNGLRMMVNTGDAYNTPPRVPLGFLHLYPDNPLVDLLYARGNNPAAPESTIPSLLWWRPVNPQTDAVEDLPRAEVFRAPSYAVMRSGYGDDDPLLLMAAAARRGHAHCETGALQLYGYGGNFIVNTGYGDALPQSHSQVLVNGRGRPFPLLDARHDVWPGLVRGDFGAGLKVECDPFFDGRAEGHLDYQVPLPGYPMDRFARYGAMIAADDGPPPYFLVYDDVDRNGEDNRYTAQFITERGREFVGDDKATMLRTLYTGAHFVHAGEPPGEGAVTWSATLPAATKVTPWLFVRNDGRSMFRIAVDGAYVHAEAHLQSHTGDQWQWQPMLDSKTKERLVLDLEAGVHELQILALPYRHIPNSTVARMLLVPADSGYAPFLVDAPDAPAGSLMLEAEAATVSGESWERREADPAPETALIAMLGSAPTEFERGFHWMRTAHGARDANMYRRLRVNRNAISAQFTTLLYPHRDGMPVPQIERLGDGFARLTWPTAVDTVSSGPAGIMREGGGVRTDAALAVVRRIGTRIAWLVVDGSALIVDGDELVAAEAPGFFISH